MLRPSSCFFGFLSLCLILCTVAVLHAAVRRGADVMPVEARRAMVKSLRLTDLCLFTDARYTRHPALADRHTPFQDYPLAFEHFPSGSLLLPPPQLRAHGLD